MKNLIDELRQTMEQRGLSPEEAARHCEVGFRSVYRWLQGESKPSAVYRRAIRIGIQRMRRLPSIRKSSAEIDHELYSLLKKKMTFEQKTWLLDVEGDYGLYRRRLRDLAAEYGVKAKE